MPSFTNRYVEPGVYIKIENVPAPNVAGGTFIPIFIGLGRKEYDISTGIERTDLTTDLITDEYTVVKILSISDSSGVYTKGVDYELSESGGSYYVDWNQPQDLLNTVDGSGGYNVDGKTLKLNIDSTSFTVTFSGTDPLDIDTDVIAQINTDYQTASGTTDSPASKETVGTESFIKLTGDLIKIEGGTALSDLGYENGQFVESKEPTEGQSYNVTYKRLKLTSEYTPKLFTRLEDVYAEWGPNRVPVTLASAKAYSFGNTTTNIKVGPSSTSPTFSGTSTASSTTTVVNVDGSPDLSNIKVGDYYVGTAGTGSGETSIVTDIDTSTDDITVSPALDTTPDATSDFNILPKTDLSDVEAGHYIKATSGVGEGQIRVVMAVDDDTNDITVSPALSQTLDETTDIVINDGPESEISIGATIAQNHGATYFLGSQSAEDIVDDDNIRKAIDNTKELTNGFQGWCLVYLKGVTASDSIVSYIKSYLNDMNAVVAKQERMALFGVKASITNFQDVITLTRGIEDARVGVVANPYARISGLGQLDGSYIASAIAGIITNPNFDAGEPISGKTLLFDYIDDPYLRQEKRQLGQYGAIVNEKQGVDYKIIHYLSTKTNDVIDSELKVIKQLDDIKKTLRNTLSSTLVNVRITQNGKNILAIADSFINLILTEKVNIGTIAGYQNVEISFNVNDPRQLDIKFEIRPTFDLNWISVVFGATIQS